ncbi:MAG: hypothetical protein WC309_04235 [Candidatus Paceibacterota bacterium]|jgi:hypothetical protein
MKDIKLEDITTNLFVPEFKIIEMKGIFIDEETGEGIEKSEWFFLREFVASDLLLYLEYHEYLTSRLEMRSMGEKDKLILREMFVLAFGKDKYNRLIKYIKSLDTVKILLEEIHKVNHVEEIFKTVPREDGKEVNKNDYVVNIGKMLLVFASEWGGGTPNNILEKLTMRALLWYAELHSERMKELSPEGNKEEQEKALQKIAEETRGKYESDGKKKTEMISVAELKRQGKGIPEDLQKKINEALEEERKEKEREKKIEKKEEEKAVVIPDKKQSGSISKTREERKQEMSEKNKLSPEQIKKLEENFVKAFYKDLPAGAKIEEETEGMINYKVSKRVG